LIHGLTDSAQFSDAVWTMPMMFALAGIAVSVGRPAMSSAKRADLPVWLRYFMWAIGGIIVGFMLTIGVSFWRPLAGVWYANLGSVYQTQADLSPLPDDSFKDDLTNQAVKNFEQALKIYPDQSTSNRRLGLIALEQQDFDAAITYLERAYTQEPNNPGTLKMLAYAYLWTDQIDAAENLFHRLDFNNRLVDEMDYWQWWWRT
jgi:tetratricopeptide (TPR) repeat protein